ncbi:MerR family transcriptional regulator [Gracilibacillus sp. S3-1-1]|uniref:MerR family transcriptional regulator n=1 Tax=Gracilibacillus pellucidus TaxID=3095368 RepID=A0ACC6MA55_9BACI|nr:MerR family transcriptional regulator [Gracilibacillus sp. S3-1-1]MDX8047697.1 MerR family transcriptional regulator [Gracilibacillus sp. S3-1-1]
MYSIGQFAKKTGVTIRTLRYYDQIGLLKPAQISAAGRRYYHDENMVQLQKIMTFRFLGYSLEKIQEMLQNDEKEFTQSLVKQRNEIQKQKEHLDRITEVLDNVIPLIEEQATVEPEIVIALIQSLAKEEEQKHFLEQYFSKGLVEKLFEVEKYDMVGFHRKEFHFQLQLKQAYRNKVVNEEVKELVKEFFTLMPEGLMQNFFDELRDVLDEEGDIEFPDGLFPSILTQEEEDWLIDVAVTYNLVDMKADE